jgi:hypothetical protein
MSTKTIRWGMQILVSVAVLAIAACSSSPASPTAAPPTAASTPTPAPVPTPPPTPPPVITASVQIAINPNPVPFSGQPITDAASCAGSPNTWFYQQNLKESAGAAVVFTGRIDSFDQRVVNNETGLNIMVPALGQMTLNSRWCSSEAVAHTAQSSFSGIDANGHAISVEGPVVNLKSP